MKKFLHGLKVGLFGLHLWFQLVYFVLFIVVSIIASLGGMEWNWSIFFIGLGPTLLVSLILTYRDKAHTQEINDILKKGTPVPDKKEAVKETKEEPASATAVQTEEEPPKAPEETRPQIQISPQAAAAETEAAINSQMGSAQNYSQPASYNTPYQNTYVQPQQPYFQAPPPVQNSYMDNMTNGTINNDFQNYISPHHAIPGYVPPQQMQEKKAEEEKPKIYRTKSDASILIYDYKDRTEYYKLGEDGSLTLKQAKYK